MGVHSLASRALYECVAVPCGTRYASALARQEYIDPLGSQNPVRRASGAGEALQDSALNELVDNPPRGMMLKFPGGGR